MSFKERALQEFASRRSQLANKAIFCGLDGFVDTIVLPVDQRQGPGDAFTAIETIPDFAARIAGAAGRSTNIELKPVMEKLGGNGPILAGALVAAGLKVTYAGALGYPDVHPVFHDFASKAKVHSFAQPSLTTAAEFKDGKIMLGMTTSLETITYDSLVKAIGEGSLLDTLSRADLIALVNWTMIPSMTEIFNALIDRAFSALPQSGGRHFFFDLADPEKRSQGDLASGLRAIARFQAHGSVTLGLNLKEATQVAAVLGLAAASEGSDALRGLASQIRSKLNLSCVVVHPRESAACATRDESWWIPGPYTDSPRVTTGAGDHFNAGFCTGLLAGLSPESCLTLGVCCSGHYVRNARSPSLSDLDSFLRAWK